ARPRGRRGRRMGSGVALERWGAAVRDCRADAVSTDAERAAIDCTLPPSALLACADRLAALGLEPQWIAAADTGAASARFRLAYHFAPPGHRPAVTARVDVDS